MGDDLLGTEGDADRVLTRKRQGLVVGIGVQALGTAQDAGQSLDGHPGDVHLRLMGGKRHAGGLRVEPQLQASFVIGAVTITHPAGPEAPSRPELAHLLEEVVVTVEEEAQSRGEVVDVHAGGHRRLHIGEPVGQREGQLLGCRRTSLTDVIAGDRHRVPTGHLSGGERNDIGDQSDRRPWREDVLLLSLILLEDVVLERAAQVLPGDATLLGDDDVHSQQDGRRPVDSHRRGHGSQVDAGVQVDHVLDGVDGHAGTADLAKCPVVVRVSAHERGHVERRGQAGAPGGQQFAEAGVGVGGRAEAGEHPHGPQAGPVHVGVHTPGVGKLAGQRSVAVHPVDGNPRQGAIPVIR